MINRIIGISIWLLLSLVCLDASAQTPDTNLLFRRRFEAKRNEIEKIKKELITDRINLKPEQAPKFWPIYDKYTEERLILRRKFRKALRAISLTDTDDDILKTVNERLALKQQEVDVEKKAKEELLKIINVRQLAELYFTEQEFLKRVLQVLLGRAEE
jgi:Spy/CpxP family protein refolding chaperone